VVLGAGSQVRQVVQVGAESLPVMLGTLAVALGGAWRSADSSTSAATRRP
jgi:hypothetical protein